WVLFFIHHLSTFFYSLHYVPFLSNAVSIRETGAKTRNCVGPTQTLRSVEQLLNLKGSIVSTLPNIVRHFPSPSFSSDLKVHFYVKRTSKVSTQISLIHTALLFR